MSNRRLERERRHRFRDEHRCEVDGCPHPQREIRDGVFARRCRKHQREGVDRFIELFTPKVEQD